MAACTRYVEPANNQSTRLTIAEGWVDVHAQLLLDKTLQTASQPSYGARSVQTKLLKHLFNNHLLFNNLMLCITYHCSSLILKKIRTLSDGLRLLANKTGCLKIIRHFASFLHGIH